MSVPAIASPLGQLGSCPFSFYPPIVNVEHNAWIFRRATWSEIQVMNTKTSEELWIPRHLVGEVSMVGEPVVIVGLIKEIEYRAGAVYPHIRRVLEMPRAVNESPRPSAPQSVGPALVVGIRVESRSRTRTVMGSIAAGLLACMAFVTVFRDGAVTSRWLARQAAARVDLPFSAQDDYESVVARLGPPAGDEWRSSGGAQYRRLWYPRHSYTVILTGRDHPRYAGAVDASGRVIHSVRPIR
ncbi:MAG TPA: hypothetical protein VNX18_08850 [Bryobacteraceae bacterium]|nr:hypothetical protein [Bryobacteraceae bacterium]